MTARPPKRPAPKSPRLKVYLAEIDGVHEHVVAAANQAAALSAFDVRQNLFAQGLARVTDDPAACKAALEHPGQVKRRKRGSPRGRFE